MEVKEQIFETMVLNIKQEKCSLIVGDDNFSDSEEQLIKNGSNIDQQQESLKDVNMSKKNLSLKHSILTHKCSISCAWCTHKFAEFDIRNHIGLMRNIEKQNFYLKTGSLLKIDSCLCARCWKFLEKTYKLTNLQRKGSKTINYKSISNSSSAHNNCNQQSFSTRSNNEVTRAKNLMHDDEANITIGPGTSALQCVIHIEPMKENKTHVKLEKENNLSEHDEAVHIKLEEENNETSEHNEIVQIKSEKENSISEHGEKVYIKLEEEIDNNISEHNSFEHFSENSVNHTSNYVFNDLDDNTGATNNIVSNRLLIKDLRPSHVPKLLDKDDNLEIDHYQTVYGQGGVENNHYNPDNTNIYSNQSDGTESVLPVITEVQYHKNLNKNSQNVDFSEDNISNSETVYFNEADGKFYSFIPAKSRELQLRSAVRRKILPRPVSNLGAKKQRLDKDQSNKTITYYSSENINMLSDENEEEYLIDSTNKVDVAAGPLRFHRTLQKVPDYCCKEMSSNVKAKNCSFDNVISDDGFVSEPRESTTNNSKSKTELPMSVRRFYSPVKKPVKTSSPNYNKKINDVLSNVILEICAEMNNPKSSNYELVKSLCEQMNGDMNKIINYLLMKEQMLIDGQLVLSENAEPEAVEYFNNHIERLSNIQVTSDTDVTSCLSSPQSSNETSTAGVYVPVKDNISISSLNRYTPSNSISIPRNIHNATYRLPTSKNNFKTTTTISRPCFPLPTAVRSKGSFVQKNPLRPNFFVHTRRNTFNQK